MSVSVVIPVYNGAKSITGLVQEVTSKLGKSLKEIVLVNDGSSDDSEAICTELTRQNPRITFISLRKNFGEHNAVLCGLNFTTGDYVAIIDDDFQNPPEEILKLLDEAKKGYDVVFARYNFKKHSLWRNLGSKFNGIMASYLLKKPQDLYLSSFKLISREVVQEIIKYRGHRPYIDGLLLRVTRNYTTCLVSHSEREFGKSNYTLTKLLSLYLSMFLNFSILPLRIFTITGFIAFTIGVILGIWSVAEKLIFPERVPTGWTVLFTAFIAFSGLQLVFLGLIGEYIGKMHFDQNGTPQWVIKSKILADSSANS